jgi:hypothetical protein
LKKKGFKEERVTTIGLDNIGKSTTLESNKSLPKFVTQLPGTRGGDTTKQENGDCAAGIDKATAYRPLDRG